jgi:hypothetical protein
MKGTCLFLSLLWEAEYKKSLEKRPRFAKTTGKHLNFHLSQGKCRLSPERKQAVCSIPVPKTCQQIIVLGTCRFLSNLDS